MLKLLVEQNLGIGGGRQSGFGKQKIYSVPDAIAQVIQTEYIDHKDTIEGAQQYLDDLKQAKLALGNLNATVNEQPALILDVTPEANNVSVSGMEDTTVVYSMTGANMCPECGQHTFVREDGCSKCYGCGYAEC